ncbi:MAG: DUF2849 domain-containing protein [Myxococcota bacterium]
MARDKGTHWVITANRTDDGAPVYLDAAHAWSERLAEALTTADDANKDTLLKQALRQERVVCDPYAFRVVLEGDRAQATTARERIRGTGPTTPLRRADTDQPTA